MGQRYGFLYAYTVCKLYFKTVFIIGIYSICGYERQ